MEQSLLLPYFSSLCDLHMEGSIKFGVSKNKDVNFFPSKFPVPVGFQVKSPCPGRFIVWAVVAFLPETLNVCLMKHLPVTLY